MSIDKDWKRKVSEPTEADFIRGLANSSVKSHGGANFWLALAAGMAVNKYIRRGK